MEQQTSKLRPDCPACASQVAQVLQLVLQEGFIPDLKTVCTIAQVSTACRTAMQQTQGQFEVISTEGNSKYSRRVASFQHFAVWLTRYPGIISDMQIETAGHYRASELAKTVISALQQYAEATEISAAVTAAAAVGYAEDVVRAAAVAAAAAAAAAGYADDATYIADAAAAAAEAAAAGAAAALAEPATAHPVTDTDAADASAAVQNAAVLGRLLWMRSDGRSPGVPFLKLRSFTADSLLVKPIVLQSLDTRLQRCHLRDFSVVALDAAVCDALQRLTNLQELTLTPKYDQGVLPERAVTAIAQLPKLHSLELTIAPSAAQLLPPSLTTLKVVFAKSGRSCCEYLGDIYKKFPAVYSSPPASSSSSSTDVADFSHISGLQELHTQATDKSGYNMAGVKSKVCTIKLPHFVGTVDVRHPARLQAAPKPPAAAQQQRGPVQYTTQHGAAQDTPPPAPAAAAAAAAAAGTQKVQASCVMLDIPQAEHAVVLHDLHLEGLNKLCLRLGTCGVRSLMFPDTSYSRLHSEQYLTEVAAALGRCSTLLTLILHVSIQPGPRLVGSIPWCDSICKLKRLQQLDITMQWLPKEAFLELTALTALTHLGLDVKIGEHTATTLLAQLPGLQSLYMNCSAMQSTAVLDTLPQLMSLQCLQLMDWGQGGHTVRMQNSQVLPLMKLKQLRKLQLPLLQHCSPVVLRFLKARMPQLEALFMGQHMECWNRPCMEIW